MYRFVFYTTFADLEKKIRMFALLGSIADLRLLIVTYHLQLFDRLWRF